MSLLPGQIIPQTVPLGTVVGNVVLIDKNWWLLLYNLVQQTLGNGSGLPADAIQDLASADLDAIDSDAISLRRPIENLGIQVDIPPDPVDLSRLLVLAQDGLLQDPPPRAQPVQSIIVGASPFTYTASFDGSVVVTGTTSSVAIVRQGSSVATGLTVGVFPMSRLDQLVVAYPGGAPTMTFLSR